MRTSPMHILPLYAYIGCRPIHMPIMRGYCTRIGELESELPSKSSEFNVATAELDSTDCHLRLAEDAASLRWEQVQKQTPQFQEMEAARFAAESARAAPDSTIQLPTTLELSLWGEVCQ